MCRFRERRSWGYECIVRGHRCATFPGKRRICEQNMQSNLGRLYEIITEYNPHSRRFERRLAAVV